jgi:hypothetical protein
MRANGQNPAFLSGVFPVHCQGFKWFRPKYRQVAATQEPSATPDVFSSMEKYG